MRTVDVELPQSASERAYPIHIGPGLLARVGEYLAPLTPSSIIVVTDRTVDALHGDAVCAASAAVAPASRIVLEGGEAGKNLSCLGRILDGLVAARADRSTLLLALGGGVVGDAAGFAAAVYMRGIRFVQLPTTLLAQVDSSVGGKTGVNHPSGKNLVGAFHQPQLVLADTATLATLPPRELSAGLAEIIKHGLLADAAYFARIERDTAALRAMDQDALTAAIARSCEIKAAIVAADERESGARALLNLGHTFGHAIEMLAGYGAWLHGEAVGCGLCLAGDLSARLGLLARGDVVRIEAAVAAAGLPVRIPGLGRAAAVDAMRGDKKARAGKIGFIVLERIGRAAQRPVDEALVDATLCAAGYT